MGAPVVALLTAGLFSVGGAVLVVCLAWILAGRLDEDPTPSARQRVIVAPTVLAALGSYVGFIAVGGTVTLSDVLGSLFGSVPAATTSLLSFTVAIFAALVGAAAGKTALDYRTEGGSVGGTVAWLLPLAVLGLVCYPAVIIAPLLLPVAPVVWYPVVTVLGTLLLGVGAGKIHRRQLEMVSPTVEEADLIGRVVEATEIAENRVHIVDSTEQGDGQWRPHSSGVGRFKHVFVPRRSREEYTDQELFAILVLLALPYRLNIRRLRVVATAVALGALVFALFSDAVTLLEPLLAILVGWLACFVVGTQIGYRKDRAVAAIVGAGALADAIEAMTSHSPEGDGLLQRVLLFRPSPEKRIAKLRAGDGGVGAQQSPAGQSSDDD